MCGMKAVIVLDCLNIFMVGPRLQRQVVLESKIFKRTVLLDLTRSFNETIELLWILLRSQKSTEDKS